MEATELRSEDTRGRSHTPWERSRRPEITDHQSQKGLHRSSHHITRQVWKYLAKRGSDGAKTKPFLLPKQTGELSTKIHSPLLLLRSLMSRESLGLSFSAHKVLHQKMWMVSGAFSRGISHLENQQCTLQVPSLFQKELVKVTARHTAIEVLQSVIAAHLQLKPSVEKLACSSAFLRKFPGIKP